MRFRSLAALPLIVAALAGGPVAVVSNHSAGTSADGSVSVEAGRTWSLYGVAEPPTATPNPQVKKHK